MKKLATALVAAVALALPAALPAQQIFAGSGCSGLAFTFCAAWTGNYVDDRTFELFITNTSGANANNGNSAFTQIEIGNLAISDPTSMDAVTGWKYDSDINGINGLLEKQFGTITSNGINNALGAGQSLTFRFNFGSNVWSGQAGAIATFEFAQLAIHDQGTPASLLGVTDCNSSKGIMSLNSRSAQNTSNPACGGPGTYSVVPEPSTYALMSAGLLGIFGVARRRRNRAA